MYTFISQFRYHKISPTLFIFSCTFIDSEEQDSNLEQDFASESIELFGALKKQKNYKNQKD